MTIQKGAQLKKIPWEKVEILFNEHGFVFKEETNNE
jgi:hypothetical protein